MTPIGHQQWHLPATRTAGPELASGAKGNGCGAVVLDRRVGAFTCTAGSAADQDTQLPRTKTPPSSPEAERTCITMRSASRLTDQAQIPNPFKAKWFGSPSNDWVRVIELPVGGMF